MTDDQFRELASGNMAEEASTALARSLSHPEPLPPLSIYRIEAELQELLEAREDAEAEGAVPDELAVFDERIKQYALAHVKKVDSTAVAIRACDAFYKECVHEAERLKKQADRHAARMKRIKSAVMWAMAQLGVTKLNTPQNTLRVQGNGGLEPLEVYGRPEDLPSNLKTITLRMPLSLWEKIAVGFHTDAERDRMKIDIEPNNEAIRAELKKRVPCPECCVKGGNTYVIGMPDCPRCDGKGVVSGSVPGARLLSRGTQLRVE